MLGMKLLRVAAVCSSLALLFGCVWFTQKQANPTMMPSSKLLVLPPSNPSSPQAVMPGSKSIAPLLTPSQSSNRTPMIMPGSKSFTGGTTINSEALLKTGRQQSEKP
jgi:hypothetical protein